MTCPHCGKPTTDAMPACVHCGKPTVRAAARDAREPVTCPRCKRSTDLTHLGELEVDLCPTCSGVWFDRSELTQFEEAVASPGFLAGTLERFRSLAGNAGPVGQRAYLSCPVCRALMSRKNFAEVSGIILDRCTAHGTWADRDDLVHMLELLDEQGGDELRRRADQRREERHHRRVRELERKRAEADSARARLQAQQRRMWGFFLLD